MDKSGTVRIRRGKKSDALVVGQVDALAVQAGLKVPGVVDRVYHHAEVRDALAAGKPVPAAVVAEYKDLNPPVTAAPRPEPEKQLPLSTPEKPLPARIDRDTLREYIGPSQWAAIRQGERGAPYPVTDAATISEMPKPVSVEPEQATPHRVDGIIEQAQAEVAIAELRKPTVRSVRAGARDLRRRGGVPIFRLTDEQVREILRKQTPRGRVQDAALQNAAVASKVAQSKAEASTLGAWARHPSNADVRTVDTKGSRGSAMLSGGAEGAGMAGGGAGSGAASGGSQPDSPGPKIDAGRQQIGLKGNMIGRSRPKFDQPRPPRIAARRTRL